FVDEGHDLVLSDLRAPYVRRLEQSFPGHDVVSIDLVHARFADVYAHHLGTFDTVFALNVVEHIADDVRALENCRRLVKPGGNVVILVPAYKWLHNELDVQLGHYRRYTRKTLVEAFSRAGLEVTNTQYFNAVATLGWAVTGGLFSRPEIPKAEATLFDRLVPLWKLADRLLARRAGLSVIAVGRVP
ncbi:MAG: methyltransferase domain-containing protein, partial [Archangium sp.]|nr:methyltransferase domain-containing protein [Archangium sp.]